MPVLTERGSREEDRDVVFVHDVLRDDAAVHQERYLDQIPGRILDHLMRKSLVLDDLEEEVQVERGGIAPRPA